MIGSITEQRDQLLALERRRQQIAQAAPVTESLSVTAAPIAAAGYTAAPLALKAAEPDITKRRKGKDRKLREGHDLAADEDPAGTAAVAEGYRAVMEAEAAARKASESHGSEGPGSYMQPGGLRPESVDRSYIAAGHASDAPTAEPPRTNPMPMTRHYVPPSEPAVARLHPGVMAAHSLGSPSER